MQYAYNIRSSSSTEYGVEVMLDVGCWMLVLAWVGAGDLAVCLFMGP